MVMELFQHQWQQTHSLHRDRYADWRELLLGNCYNEFYQKQHHAADRHHTWNLYSVDQGLGKQQCHWGLDSCLFVVLHCAIRSFPHTQLTDGQRGLQQH